MKEKNKICMVSLGCSKNLVDAEGMLFALKEAGFNITEAPEDADCVIVNTCSFIEAAQQEAIDTVLEIAELKKSGNLSGLVVTGCMAQMFKQQVLKEMPEVDAVLGTGSYNEVVNAVKSVLAGKNYTAFGNIDNGVLHHKGRLLSTPPYTAYLKIAEGCDNHCAYCIIPSLRGKFRSRPIQDIVDEAETLAEKGVRELIVIAQDTTRYGIDLYGEYSLHLLLPKLCAINGIKWVRLHYLYPDKITDKLLSCIAENEKIVKYFDIPIQHTSDKILEKMNRSGNSAYISELFSKIRTLMPDAVLRTSVMVGFPGETEADFEELCKFIDEIRFDRLGVFVFSPQEDTPAYTMPNQVGPELASHRQQIIMELQGEISLRQNEKRIGREFDILYEDKDYEGKLFGRSYMDSPDIDGKVYFTEKRPHNVGDFVRCRIEKANIYDLYGKEI